jgi:membrane-bound lytic murein transglycosylase A
VTPSEPQAVHAAHSNTDPSYVFFRVIPDNDAGPIGALGVPLTAGRSLAVDPRTTPLGAPVFISTTEPGRKEPLNRLMLAQDTGGAIRGAVRADYFWGYGKQAFVRASRMKQNGRMWLLLPKDLQLGARVSGIAVRGGADDQDAECLVPDPELCVE